MGVPVLPEAVPGAAVSPGSKTWSFTKDPTPTATAELVPAAMPGLVTSLAVTVQLPTVRFVTVTIMVPPDRAPLAGSTALASLEVICTVSLVLMRL